MFSNDEMDFTELIQSYFLKRTGKGLIFSSRDLDLILKWESLGCSPATICKGIDLAVEKSRRPPRDLFGCRKYIEEGFGPKEPKTQVKTRPKPVHTNPVQDTPQPDPKGTVGELIKSLDRAYPHADFRALYEDALKGEEDPDLEESIFEKAFLSLDEEEQIAMDEAILRKLKTVLNTMSPRARSATIAAKRRMAMEEKIEAQK